MSPDSGTKTFKSPLLVEERQARRGREKNDKDKFLEPPAKMKPSEHEAMIAKILAREFVVPIPGYVKVIFLFSKVQTCINNVCFHYYYL